MTQYPSKLIEQAVDEFSRLPGIGKKSALRLVLHLLNRPETDAEDLGNAVVRLRKEIRYCRRCHNIADQEICSICANPGRNQNLVCVVESMRDVMAVENTNQFRGIYHVLGGLIAPIDGIGPDELNIDSLLRRVEAEKIEEIILALSPTMEGDTTIFYLSQQLAKFDVKLTTLARGVSFGGELVYVDELTLARSLATRRPYLSGIDGGVNDGENSAPGGASR